MLTEQILFYRKHNKLNMKRTHLLIGTALGIISLMSSCQNKTTAGHNEHKVATYNVNDPKSIAENVVHASGGIEKLKSLKDVTYLYTYNDLAKGAKDISTERYVFEGELSYGKYSTHKVHVSPDLDGSITQVYDGKNAFVMHNNAKLETPEAVGTAMFLRQVNYFWLTMFFKMNDPGTIHEFMGKEKVGGITYDKLKVTYNAVSTGKEVNDGYILYVNPLTKLVDQFLFSLPAMGVNDIVLLMKVDYEEFKGVKLPTTRKMHAPDGKGGHTPNPVLIQTSTGLTFNNGFKTSDFTAK